MAVFNLLQQKTEPTGLKELLDGLGTNYAESSVRRSLVEMVQSGLLRKLGEKRKIRYEVAVPYGAAYSFKKSSGFDELRVRYRQQRRALLREIILENYSGTAMKEFISSQTEKVVRAEEREAFIEDVHEDLKAMDRIRIAGLGITPEELELWMKKNQPQKTDVQIRHPLKTNPRIR
jgi:hypothetical protein